MRRHQHWRGGAWFALPHSPERKRFKGLTSIFGGPPSPPKPPPPTPMPDLGDPALLAQQKRELLAKQNSGRQSTILSGGGSDEYSGTKLGMP